MTKFTQNSTAAAMALAIVAITWLPVISVPPAEASAILAMPILA